MKKNSSDRTREFFLALIGKDKPFKFRSNLAEYLGMAEPSKKTKFFKFLDGRDSAFSVVSEWIERIGGSIFLPNDDPATLANYRFVPKVAAVAGAGATLETSDEVLGWYAFKTDFLGRQYISEKKSVLMDVRGDSMEPLLKDGDTVLIDQADTEIMDGRIYVVTLGDELRVKRVQKSMRGYVLRSENPRYADIAIEGIDLEQFKVHGRVRWVGKLL